MHEYHPEEGLTFDLATPDFVPGKIAEASVLAKVMVWISVVVSYINILLSILESNFYISNRFGSVYEINEFWTWNRIENGI